MKNKLKTYEVHFDTLVVNARNEEEAKEIVIADVKKGYYPPIIDVKIWE